MEEPKTTLLIVEDDLDIADMLNAYFRVQGFEVKTANWGEDGVAACQNDLPDLVILDIRLPDIDGFEVARRLRANRRTKDIPILFLTEKRERVDRLKGLELHAEDYITKPFDIQELRLRVRNALERHQRSTLTHPVTGLPVGNLVDETLSRCLRENNWAILIVCLKHLDYFREQYGFVASDDFLRATSVILQTTIRQSGTANDFLGQLSGIDFILITQPSLLSGIKENIRRQMEESIDYFYRDTDRSADAFSAKRISVQLMEYHATQNASQDLQHFRQELERLCH